MCTQERPSNQPLYELPVIHLLTLDRVSAWVIAVLRRKNAIMHPAKKLPPTYTWVSNISIPIAVKDR